MVALETNPTANTRRALCVAGLLLSVELLAIGSLHKHTINFTCHTNWPLWACHSANWALLALYCMIGAGLLFWMLRPAPLRQLVRDAGRHRWVLALNIIGVVIALVPLSFVRDGAGVGSLLPAFAFWTLGMGLLLGSLALYIAPVIRWRQLLHDQGLTLLPILGAAALAPWLSTLLRPIWRLETISQVTFETVVLLVRGLGYEIQTPPGTKNIGNSEFMINVAPQCSGVEGLALVTVFVSIYLSLFRRDLMFPRAFMLFPIGLIASAVFNVFRIALLLVIGIEGNPELAIGGFHSHAGWMMFTVVALGIVALAQTVPALQKGSGIPGTVDMRPVPLLQDPMVARILPFAVFMLSALLASALTQNPSLVYPLRVLAMAAVLAMFWPIYARLDWRFDPVALGAGIAIGLMWVLIPVAPGTGAAPYGTLTGVALVGWFLLRGLGTIVLVPIIEELFFRDYLERRLRFGTGPLWPLLAAVVTAGLFAALHDRWMEAFIAGLIFSAVMARKGRVSDAIIAHAAANALVFAVAVASGNLAII